MEFEGKYDEIIFRYFEGQMDQKEKNEFESKLKSDLLLSQEYESFKYSIATVKQAGRFVLRNRLEQFESEIVNSGTTRSTIRKIPISRYIGIAASIVVLIGLFWFFSSSRSDQLYANYFQPYEAPTSLRGDTQATEWNSLFEVYNVGDYEVVIALLEKKEFQPDYLRYFYLAQCYAQLERPDFNKAIKNCNLVINSDNDYVQQAKWYKGLFLVRLEKKSEAKRLFQEIIDNNDYKSKEAAEIIHLLD